MPRTSVDGEVASPSEPRIRQRFGYEEDRLLAQQVREDAPYKARHGAIGGTWDAVAEKLNEHPDFHMRPIKGTTAKTRFDTLVTRHRVWKEAASISGSNTPDSPYRQVMDELLVKIDARLKGNVKEGEEDDAPMGEAAHKVTEPRTRLGKRRASSDNVEAEAERREVAAMHRPSMEQILNEAVETDRVSEVASPVVKVAKAVQRPVHVQEQPSIAGGLLTVQQAMAELFKMQEAIALQPRVADLEKQNEARLREEEKTKQRSLELQIEMERTKRRQLELEFEREERKKDREEQSKLIASLLQRLEPKSD